MSGKFNSYFLPTVFLLAATFPKLLAQCFPVAWPDKELNFHTTFLARHTTVPEYVYYYPKYKATKVVEVNHPFDSDNPTAIETKKFNKEGYLIYEVRFNRWSTKELHSLSYSNNYKTVIDSIRYIPYLGHLSAEQLQAIDTIKKDTVLYIQRRVFNDNLRIVEETNKFFIPFNYDLFKLIGQEATTNMFFGYDACGNCTRVTFVGGPEFIYEYEYVALPEGYQKTITLKASPMHSQNTETWEYNKDSLLIYLNTCTSELLKIEYNKNKIVLFGRSHGGMNESETTTYKYSKRGDLIKMKTTYGGSLKSMSPKTLKIQRYKNGLEKTDRTGLPLTYRYWTD